MLEFLPYRLCCRENRRDIQLVSSWFGPLKPLSSKLSLWFSLHCTNFCNEEDAEAFWFGLGFDTTNFEPISHRDFNRPPWILKQEHYDAILNEYQNRGNLQLPISDSLAAHLQTKPANTKLELDVIFSEESLIIAFAYGLGYGVCQSFCVYTNYLCHCSHILIPCTC